MDKKKYFQILGIPEDSTREEIQSAYTEKVGLWKNKLSEEDPSYGEKKRQQLQEAYDVLMLGMDESGRFPPEDPEKTNFEKALGIEKGYKPFYKRGFVYTNKPQKDVRLIQYLFLAAAGIVVVGAVIVVLDTLKMMF